MEPAGVLFVIVVYVFLIAFTLRKAGLPLWVALWGVLVFTIPFILLAALLRFPQEPEDDKQTPPS